MTSSKKISAVEKNLKMSEEKFTSAAQTNLAHSNPFLKVIEATLPKFLRNFQKVYAPSSTFSALSAFGISNWIAVMSTVQISRMSTNVAAEV